MDTLGALSGRTFDAVLLDMDGTLVDSTPAVTRSWLRWAREEDVDPALLVGRHGVPAVGIVAAVMPERDEGARAAALERIEAIEVADTEGVVVLPGAVDALRSLAHGRRSAVVTSSTRPLALARIDAAALPAPAVVVTASDVERGKPDPQPFLLAARRLGVDPRRCLVVEDAPAGLAAGRAAGCATLALSTTHAEGELAGSADAVVADLSAVTFGLGADGAVTVVAADRRADDPPVAPGARPVEATSAETPAGEVPPVGDRPVDTAYEDLLRAVLATGTPKADRTGTGTRSLFGHQLRYDLSAGFPLVTTKRVHLRSVVVELLWFLRGDSDARWLQERGVRIWDAWAGPDGDLGPVYGVQWRSWPTPDGGHVDQLSQVLETLRTDPDSRRMVVSAWNVADIPAMALAPCHALFQLHVAEGRLSCQVYQRSADLFLGVPFNIASYALLTHMIAQEVGLGVGDLVWTGGDCHVYDNHVDQVREQLGREAYPFPTLRLRRAASLFDHEVEDVEVVGYRHHPTITAPVAV